jgi:hypothetical protein
MSIRVKRNGEWVEVQSNYNLDDTLSIEGKAADAKAVGDKFDDLPLAIVDSDSTQFTEVLGLRRPTNIRFIRDGNSIKVQTTIAPSGEIVNSIIDLDDNGYPTKVILNGQQACSIEW